MADSAGEIDRSTRKPIDFYDQWVRETPLIERRTAQTYGKPVKAFDQADYNKFLASINLNTNEGLMTWSAATGIPVVALTRDSDFFYYNKHLTADKVKQTVQPVKSINGYTVADNFAPDKLNYEVLSPYLTTPDKVPNRAEIAEGIRSMPLNMVKALHGRSLYLSTERGRSYTISMPVSNSVYSLFAGMTPGPFFEARAKSETAETLVHESCHALLNTVVKNRYGSILYSTQSAPLQQFSTRADQVFGKNDSDVPQTPYGYISRYSRTNAQENGAEHCMAYVYKNDKFLKQAQAEEAAGHPELMAKYNLMKDMLAEEPQLEPLSAEDKRFAPPAEDKRSSTVAEQTASQRHSEVSSTATSQPSSDQASCPAALERTVKDREAALRELTGQEATCRVEGTKSLPYEERQYLSGHLHCTFASNVSAEKLDTAISQFTAQHYLNWRRVGNGANPQSLTGDITTSICRP